MNYKVVTLRVIGVTIYGDGRFGAFVRGMSMVDLNIDPAL